MNTAVGTAQEQGYDPARFAALLRTLIFVLNGDDVLLMQRAPHKKAFPGKYNALGGHVERGEDPLGSALREVREECGLTLDDLRLCGISLIDLPEGQSIALLVYAGAAKSRFVTDSAEGTLHWVAVTALDTLKAELVADVPLYLERALLVFNTHGSPFSARVTHDSADKMYLYFNNHSASDHLPAQDMNL